EVAAAEPLEDVSAAPADDHVGAATPPDRVRVWRADQAVGLLGSLEHLIVGGDRARPAARAATGAQRRGRAQDRLHADLAAGEAGDVVAWPARKTVAGAGVVADQLVVARAAGEGVWPGGRASPLADQRVVSAIAVQGVGAGKVAAEEHLPARGAVELV